MNVDLVFEGGGVLGVSFVGAFKALAEKGYQIQRCAGTSAGSIVSALIMAGYTPDELTGILYDTDFKLFMKKTPKGTILGIGPLLSLVFDKGQYDSKIIETWMDDLLIRKGIIKFKHVMAKGKSRLKIIAADITKRTMLILPDDLVKYGINPLEFSIAKAVSMSCAIPFYFTPVELKYNANISLIVDGGLISSFPIWIFDTEGIPRWPTFGIKIKDLASNSSQGKTNIFAYFKDIIDTPINKDEQNFIHNKDFVRTIIIDYDGRIHPTDFDKVDKHGKYLYDTGYESTLKFLNRWSFRRYVQLFSSQNTHTNIMNG